MSVGIQENKNLGVIRVILTTLPQLHPFSDATNAPDNYICYALDMKGFQVEIDLQGLPAGVTLSQLQPNQVWWVEKRTSLYRLFLYGGIFNPSIKQIVSTSGLIMPPNGDLNGTYNVPVVTGLQGIPVVSGQPTIGQTLTYTANGWAPATASGSSSSGVPAGTLLDFAGSSAPTGYLLCDGTSYSTTTYSDLFSAIGYAWGGSAGNFNVPDLRGRVTIGAGSGTGLTLRTLATYSGEENHVLASGETPLISHTHTFTVPSSTGTTSTGTSSSVSLNTSAGYSTGTGTTNSTTTAAGSASISSGNTGSGAANISASTSVSISDPGHTHSAGSYAFMVYNTGGGGNLYGTGTPSNHFGTANPTQSATTGITSSATTSASDSGHTHSLSGVSVSIPSLTVNGATIPALTIPTMTVTGSVAIPGLNFTVPAQTGLTTSGNTATTASGHNNMQPYAVVTKIIKY
jgi:microcystin-dependent protein